MASSKLVSIRTHMDYASAKKLALFEADGYEVEVSSVFKVPDQPHLKTYVFRVLKTKVGK